jgi:hypothetical protein
MLSLPSRHTVAFIVYSCPTLSRLNKLAIAHSCPLLDTFSDALLLASRSLALPIVVQAHVQIPIEFFLTMNSTGPLFAKEASLCS